MAHALHGYEGLCKNIHGHTYHLHVTLSGVPLHDSGRSTNGMVIDFSDLKSIVKEKVVGIYDHALVLNGNSPHQALHSLIENFEKVIFVDYQPTCENLLQDIVAKIKGQFPEECFLHSVKLEETPSSYAEWFYSDNVL